jgi:hypothetical protein
VHVQETRNSDLRLRMGWLWLWLPSRFSFNGAASPASTKATRRGNGHGKTLHVRLKNLQACPFAN